MKWHVFPNPDGSWHIFKDGAPLPATIETAELIASTPVLDEFARSNAAGQLDLIEARSLAQTTLHHIERRLSCLNLPRCVTGNSVTLVTRP